MRTLNQRIVCTLLTTLIVAACGMLVGYWCGRQIILHHRFATLDQFALRNRASIEASSTEGRRVLDKINSSPYPHCSAAELDYFDGLLFRSEYLKDIGRIRDGQIACSASFGLLDIRQRAARPQPLFMRKDGISVYRDPLPFRTDGLTTIAIQRGEGYIVYNPYNLKSMASLVMHFTVSDSDAPGSQARRLGGDVPPFQNLVLVREGSGMLAGSLYATRCSVRYSSCVTAFMSIPEALRIEHGEMRGYIVISAFFGALLGLACSVLYRRTRSMAQQLRRAIRHETLDVHYQPIFELATRRIVGAEALARWTDQDGRPVSPDVFIKVAEENGFVGEITRLVLRRILRDLKILLLVQPDFRVNINIAAADLASSAFLPMIETALDAEGIAPEHLGIELTEGSTARLPAAQRTILCLRNMGHVVNIDDFGTGYSSLAYLQDLSVDVIKIDKAFTQSIGTGSVKVSIVPQILSMAAALNLDVVVEGIETEEQANYFAKLGQPVYVQGWLFGRAMPCESLLRLMQQTANSALDAAVEESARSPQALH